MMRIKLNGPKKDNDYLPQCTANENQKSRAATSVLLISAVQKMRDRRVVVVENGLEAFEWVKTLIATQMQFCYVFITKHYLLLLCRDFPSSCLPEGEAFYPLAGKWSRDVHPLAPQGLHTHPRTLSSPSQRTLPFLLGLTSSSSSF